LFAYHLHCVHCVLQGIRPAEEVEAAAAAGSGAFYSPEEVQAMDPKQVQMLQLFDEHMAYRVTTAG
jgi:hypothetical protein